MILFLICWDEELLFLVSFLNETGIILTLWGRINRLLTSILSLKPTGTQAKEQKENIL